MKKKYKWLIISIYYFIILIILGVSYQAAAQKKIPFSIGVEIKKIPYSYLNKEGEISGILIDQIRSHCKTLNLECSFVKNTMENLLYQLKISEIQAVLVQDFFVIPKVDKIVLSSPLCKINPIFIQKKSDPLKSTIEAFKGTTIGVKKASILHLYLLDHYNSFVNIKTYIQLESGIFDLVSKRIDVLFSGEAFFKSRVLNMLFNSDNNPHQLTTLNMEKLLDSKNDFNKIMSLAFKEGDIKYIDKFKLFLSQSKLKPCIDLLKNSQTSLSDN